MRTDHRQNRRCRFQVVRWMVTTKSERLVLMCIGHSIVASQGSPPPLQRCPSGFPLENWRVFPSTYTHSDSWPRVHYLSISSKSNESAAHEWIHRILLFLPPLIPHMHSIAFTNLPILHPSFIALASKFTSVKSLELYSFKAQSFGEIIRLVNRYSNLEQLSIVDCKWNTPTYYVSERQHNITNLTLRNRAKCQRDALTWALTSCSTLTLRQFTCLISNPATVELEEERVLKTCQSTLFLSVNAQLS